MVNPCSNARLLVDYLYQLLLTELVGKIFDICAQIQYS